MLGKVKANTTDKYLTPIRKQIVEFVQTGATVIDYGCGNGDLLFKLSHKIESGIGFDISPSLISYAKTRKEQEHLKNIDFELLDLANQNLRLPSDYGIASLVFHVLEYEKSLEVLNRIIELSDTTIVCAFSKPKTQMQYFLLWLDQVFNKHYKHFVKYRKLGYMEGMLKKVHKISWESFSTFDPVIKIYMIKKVTDQVQ